MRRNIFFLKTIGSKISAGLYYKIKDELDRIGKTKSEFLRMLINNYFKDLRLKEENKKLVNRLTPVVNHLSAENQYQTTKKEVDRLLSILK